MRIRALLTAGAAAALAAAAFAAAGGANAAAAPATAGYIGTSAHLTMDKTAAVFPSRNSRQAAAAAAARGTAAAPCTEPDCNLPYHGGPVQHSPHVYVVFWGSGWNTDATQTAAEQYLISFYKGLGQSPDDDWSKITAQYTDKTGHPVLGKSLFAGSYVDATALPDQGSGGTGLTITDLSNELNNAATHFKLTVAAADNAEIVIAAESGTCFAPNGSVNFAGNCGTLQSGGGYCAYHSFAGINSTTYLPVVILPYSLDAGQGCGENFVNSGSAGMFDGFSMTAGHETAETITDPTLSAWIDTGDAISGGEVADKCAWGGSLWNQTPADPFGNVTLSTGSFAMQSLWSNVKHSCVMAGKLPFKVTPLGNQTSTTGKPVSVQVHAATTPASALTFGAAGLPGGVSINSKTGHIGGTPNVTAGTFTVKITVSYYDGSQSFSFTWKVGSPAGPVKGYASKCVDDAGGHTTNGNKIDISTCNGKSQQRIVFFPSGELTVLGKCITGTSSAFLEPCKAATSQIWTRHADGAYVLKANGECLTDPGNSTKDGTRLTLAACKNTVNQRWTLP